MVCVGLGFGVIGDCECDECPKEEKGGPTGEPVGSFKEVVVKVANERECCKR